MYKVYTENVDGRMDYFIVEDYEDEAEDMFLKADIDAQDKVEVLYTIDSITGEQIELWRQDWIIESQKDK